MNPEKAAIKVAVIHDLGADMDDMLEQSRRMIQQLEGGAAWMGKAHVAVTQISQRVDAERDAGKMPEDVAAVVKKYLGMALQSITDLGTKAAASKLGQEGIASGIERCVKHAKKKMDTEQLKLESAVLKAKKAAESGEEPRPRGSDAADDLKRRKAEAKAAKEAAAKKEAEEAAQEAAGAPEPAKEPEVPATPKKTRGARGKGRKTPSKPPAKAPAKKKATKKRSSRAGGTKRSASNS